jgi:hypothetical protein
MSKKTKKNPEMVGCPRCDGDREEPGAPTETDGSMALCLQCKGYVPQKTVTIRLVLDVTYKTNGVETEDLGKLLDSIPHHAAGHGMFSGETAAEVEKWEYKVSVRR